MVHRGGHLVLKAAFPAKFLGVYLPLREFFLRLRYANYLGHSTQFIFTMVSAIVNVVLAERKEQFSPYDQCTQLYAISLSSFHNYSAHLNVIISHIVVAFIVNCKCFGCLCHTFTKSGVAVIWELFEATKCHS